MVDRKNASLRTSGSRFCRKFSAEHDGMRGLPIGGLKRRQSQKKDQISANFGKIYETSSVVKTTVFPHTQRHVRGVKMILRTPSFIISNKKDGYWLPLVPQTAKRKKYNQMQFKSPHLWFLWCGVCVLGGRTRGPARLYSRLEPCRCETAGSAEQHLHRAERLGGRQSLRDPAPPSR